MRNFLHKNEMPIYCIYCCIMFFSMLLYELGIMGSKHGKFGSVMCFYFTLQVISHLYWIVHGELLCREQSLSFVKRTWRDTAQLVTTRHNSAHSAYSWEGFKIWTLYCFEKNKKVDPSVAICLLRFAIIILILLVTDYFTSSGKLYTQIFCRSCVAVQKLNKIETVDV